MKKGILKGRLTLSHRNGNKVIRAGEEVTENCVHDFDAHVKKGDIILNDEPEKKAKTEKRKN